MSERERKRKWLECCFSPLLLVVSNDEWQPSLELSTVSFWNVGQHKRDGLIYRLAISDTQVDNRRTPNKHREKGKRSSWIIYKARITRLEHVHQTPLFILDIFSSVFFPHIFIVSPFLFPIFYLQPRYTNLITQVGFDICGLLTGSFRSSTTSQWISFFFFRKPFIMMGNKEFISSKQTNKTSVIVARCWPSFFPDYFLFAVHQPCRI